MHRAQSEFESQTGRPLHTTGYSPSASGVGLFNPGTLNPTIDYSPATLQDKVFKEIYELKSQLQQPMELAKIASLFNRSANLVAFSRKLNLSVNILRLILGKYHIGMIELRLNANSEDILVKVASAPEVWVENFARRHNLAGCEFENYLLDKFSLPYWKIRLLKTNMGIFLADLRGTNMGIGWEQHLIQLYGASFTDLNHFSYHLFHLPLAHAIQAIKYIDEEVFKGLFYFYYQPIQKINPAGMADLVAAIRANFMAAHNIQFTGIFFRTDASYQSPKGVTPGSYLINPSAIG